MVKQWVIKKPSSEFSNTIISRPLGRVITLLRAKICGSRKFRNCPPKSNSISTTQITAQFPRYVVVLQFIVYSTMIFNMGILHFPILSLGWWFCFCRSMFKEKWAKQTNNKRYWTFRHWLRQFVAARLPNTAQIASNIWSSRFHWVMIAYQF